MKLPTLSANELRSPLKIVNHSEILRKKLSFAYKLKLLPANQSSGSEPKAAWEILESLRKEKISINECLHYLAELTESNESDLRREILGVKTTPNLEIHPTDLCNLKCYYCSFERTKSQMALDLPVLAVKTFEPCAITFAGGGETSVSEVFPSIVESIATLYPEVKLGWITNGILPAKAHVAEHMSWVRISVDSASEDMHQSLKGRRGFEQCLENFIYLLDKTDIPNIGLGFLIQSKNIIEVSAFISEIWNLIKGKDKSTYNRVNIQFRPLRPSQEIFLSVLSQGAEWEYMIDDNLLREQISLIASMRSLDSGLDDFLRENTNIETLNLRDKADYWMPNQPFSFCSVSLLYTLLRADGSLYSCIHKSESPQDSLGSISVVDLPAEFEDKILKATLLRYWLMGLNAAGCNFSECRYSHLNNISEEAQMKQSKPLSKNLKFNPFW